MTFKLVLLDFPVGPEKDLKEVLWLFYAESFSPLFPFAHSFPRIHLTLNKVVREERCEQTEQITTADANVGNESDSKEYECTAVQCERVSILEDSAQTFTPSTRNDDTMTETVPCSVSHLIAFKKNSNVFDH